MRDICVSDVEQDRNKLVGTDTRLLCHVTKILKLERDIEALQPRLDTNSGCMYSVMM